jgi:succinate dehydrogenase/fumarate reductase flavoprotein subunit
MREDDDKYELKKTLIELDKAKGERNQILEELSECLSQNCKTNAIRGKLDKALAKYVGACRKEESLEETIEELQEGREQL